MYLSLWNYPRSNRLPGLITWTPFYLSLILLLQTLTLPAPVHANIYGESCTENTDCSDTHYCSTQTHKCDCVKFGRRRWISFYDFDTKECLSIVDKVCARVETSNTLFPKCVPKASCKVPTVDDINNNLGGNDLATNLGICKCDAGFEKNDRSLCSLIPPQPVIPTSSGGNKDLGIFGSMMGQGGRSDLPSAAPSTEDKTDPNRNIDVDTSALPSANGKGGRPMAVVSGKVSGAFLAVILVYFNNALQRL